MAPEALLWPMATLGGMTWNRWNDLEQVELLGTSFLLVPCETHGTIILARVTLPQQVLSTKTPDFVDKTLKERILSTKTPYFVDKTESTGISYIIP